MTKFKKVFSLLALSLIVLSFTSSETTKKSVQNEQILPALIDAKLKAANGNLVLINFWASYDASSHVQNITFSEQIKSLKTKKFKHASGITLLSVSVDEFHSIFTESVKRDCLDTATSIRINEGLQKQLFKAFNLSKSFGNVLLDQNGVIVAKNLSSEELTAIIQNEDL